ncbi:MAG: asparaginase [Chloroflexia bacterium]
MDAEVLVEFTRGPLVEAVHRGHAAVVDSAGRLLAWLGNPDHICFMRSSAKPLQILPLLEDRLDERFGFTDEELAVMAASHTGEERHVRTVARILARLGLDERALRCGVHPPENEAAYLRLRLLGGEPGPLHNNCSGKHAAMLAIALAGGHPLESYPEPDHPVQQRILQVIREMTGVADPILGIDGCGVPVFGLPLRAMALAYARLIDPAELPARRAAACRRATAAMRAHPGMVSGEGCLGEALMPATRGRLVVKGGAEGLIAVGVEAPATPDGRGVGVVLKMEDGSGGDRAIRPALLELLSQLGFLQPEERAALAAHDFGPVRNCLGQVVGESRPAFRVHKHAAEQASYPRATTSSRAER